MQIFKRKLGQRPHSFVAKKQNKALLTTRVMAETENKAVQRTVNLSLGLSDMPDEETLMNIRNENRKKSTVNLTLGLSRMESLGEEEVRYPGNPMMKVGLEVANDEESCESQGDEHLLSMAAMMTALGNDSVEGEAWETRADKKRDSSTGSNNKILEQLGITLESEDVECWERKASTDHHAPASESVELPSDNVFNMLGLSAADMESSGEAWESKKII